MHETFVFLAALLALAVPAHAIPFEPGNEALMPAGKHKGKLQNTETKRPARLLNDVEARAYGTPSPDYIYVANTFHLGQWFVARIPITQIKDVIVHVEHFAPELVAAHTQLRFQFNEEVELIPQERPVADGIEVVHVTNNLVFSAEYSAPVGVEYGLVPGLRDFAIVHRLISLEEKRHYMIDENKHRVGQIRLAFSPAEKVRALLSALRIASEEGMHVMYDTLNHSCTTQMFRVIDLALDNRARWNEASFMKKIWLVLRYLPVKIAQTVTSRMPVMARRAVCERMLLGKDSKMPNLNDEIL